LEGLWPLKWTVLRCYPDFRNSTPKTTFFDPTDFGTAGVTEEMGRNQAVVKTYPLAKVFRVCIFEPCSCAQRKEKKMEKNTAIGVWWRVVGFMAAR